MDNLFKTRVSYLLANEPRLTWERFQQDRQGLFEDITSKVETAITYKKVLVEKGWTEEEATALTLKMLAPEDPFEEKERLSDSIRAVVMKWAENPPESDKLKIAG